MKVASSVVIPTWLLVSAAIVFGSSALIQLNKDRLNLFLMGVFRDIGRYKAYKRRYNKDMALMTILLHQEDDPLLNSIDQDGEDDVPEYTLDELWEYGNGHDDAPLLFSIFGRIYDVSAGEKFYGPDATYGVLVGHEVTYALATGCKTCALDKEKTANDLNDKQLQEGKRWLSFFQLHDKYPYVGKLDKNPMQAKMDEWIDAAIAKKMSEDDLGSTTHPALNMMANNEEQEEEQEAAPAKEEVVPEPVKEEAEAVKEEPLAASA